MVAGVRWRNIEGSGCSIFLRAFWRSLIMESLNKCCFCTATAIPRRIVELSDGVDRGGFIGLRARVDVFIDGDA